MCNHYLLSNEFIVHSDHESLKHVKWVKFLEQFSYVIIHKQEKANIVAEALSRRQALLAMLETKLLGFVRLKDLYVTNVDFSETYDHCTVSANRDFFWMRKHLYVPKSFIRELLVKEAHEGGLMGHFGVRKTYEAWCEHFYWPRMRRNVHHIC
ncbi:hypothetical protein CR513_39897, partial [Mucuna pruriens]